MPKEPLPLDKENGSQTVAVQAPKWMWPTLLVLAAGAGVSGWAHSFVNPAQAQDAQVSDIATLQKDVGDLGRQFGAMGNQMAVIATDIDWIKKELQRNPK